MSIGANIKRLRKERDITQEQLADFLHVTPSAISQWETGRVIPDVIYLPKLAYLFQVSADVLLGIDVSSKEKKIQEIYDKAHKYGCVGERERAIKICREGLDKFPNAYSLMEELADNLIYATSSGTKEILESISLFETILNNSNDELRKNYAIGNLCTLYTRMGRAEEAHKLAEAMPEMTFSREECLLSVLHGEEYGEALRSQILEHFDRMVWKLHNFAEFVDGGTASYTETDAIELWRKIIVFVETLYEKGDYGFDEYLFADGYFCQAKLYAGIGENEKAVDSLETAVGHIERYDSYCEERYCRIKDNALERSDMGMPSLLMRKIGSDCPDQQNVFASAESIAAEFLKKMSDKRLDLLRGNPRFQEAEKRLREKVR